MAHEEAKNSRLNPNPIHKVKLYILLKSLFDSSLFCIMAEEKPMFVKSSKKAIMTVAIATIPKSSGVSNRASTAITPNEITMPEYLAMAV